MEINHVLYRNYDNLTVCELMTKLNDAKELLNYLYKIANAYIDSKYSTDDAEGNKLRDVAFNGICARVNLTDIFEIAKCGLEDADGIAERNADILRTKCRHLDGVVRNQAIDLQRSDIPLRVKYEVFDACRDVDKKTGELQDLWWKVVTNDDLMPDVDEDETEEEAEVEHLCLKGIPF